MVDHDPDGLQIPTEDDIRRLLEASDAVRVASGPQRTGAVAGQLAGLLRADAAAVDFVGPDGRAVRVAVIGTPPAVDVTDRITIPATGVTPEVALRPPEADRPAAIRSVYRHDGAASALYGWRPAGPFGLRHVTLLRVLHPAVAWAIEPAPSGPGGVTGAVLELMLAGLTEREIARRLQRSAHTIHAHVKRVYRHYGVTRRSELIIGHFGRRPDEVL